MTDISVDHHEEQFAGESWPGVTKLPTQQGLRLYQAVREINWQNPLCLSQVYLFNIIRYLGVVVFLRLVL